MTIHHLVCDKHFKEAQIGGGIMGGAPLSTKCILYFSFVAKKLKIN
jgi:hypothetical protein